MTDEIEILNEIRNEEMLQNDLDNSVYETKKEKIDRLNLGYVNEINKLMEYFNLEKT